MITITIAISVTINIQHELHICAGVTL
jgi:hypothetical protein